MVILMYLLLALELGLPETMIGVTTQLSVPLERGICTLTVHGTMA